MCSRLVVYKHVAFSESLGIELNIYRAEVAPFKIHLVFHYRNPSSSYRQAHVIWDPTGVARPSHLKPWNSASE